MNRNELIRREMKPGDSYEFGSVYEVNGEKRIDADVVCEGKSLTVTFALKPIVRKNRTRVRTEWRAVRIDDNGKIDDQDLFANMRNDAKVEFNKNRGF